MTQHEPWGHIRVGLSALLLEFRDDSAVSAVYSAALTDRDLGGFAADEIVPAARTLLLDGVDVELVLDRVDNWLDAGETRKSGEAVELPITYDGPDLLRVAKAWDCTTSEVAAFHASLEHEVAFCGFAPGFAYCTGIPSGRELPRLDEPRTSVPAGSVGLASNYTGVYPRTSPGGWNLIGRVLVPIWSGAESEPALLTPGTRVRFRP
jgi:KipI family sensor histidine kinase inhibitor